MKRYRLAAVFLAASFLFSGCAQDGDSADSRNDGEESTDVSGTEQSDDMADAVPDTSEQQMNENEVITEGSLPDELVQIPGGYYSESEYPGTLVELEYDTYESMTYEQQDQVLHKRAIVYLPYDYSEDNQYNVFYLMHGGWSNETTYLGTPDRPAEFKNVLDNAMADVSDGTFRYADNEREGNLYFLEQEGGVHSGEYAQEYFYNGMCWIWQ